MHALVAVGWITISELCSNVCNKQQSHAAAQTVGDSIPVKRMMPAVLVAPTVKLNNAPRRFSTSVAQSAERGRHRQDNESALFGVVDHPW